MKDSFGGLARWQWIATAVIGMLMAVLPFSAAFADQAPPGTGPKNLHRFQVANPPAQFDLVQIGLDYAAEGESAAALGAVVKYLVAPEYAYGGAAYNTVMAGEITVSINGADKTYKDGDTWTIEAGQTFRVRNMSLDHAVVFSSVLLPKGASLTTTKQGASAQAIPAGPATLFMTRFPVSNAPSPLDLVQAELDQAPGSWTATHTHPGAVYNTVIQGKLMVRADGQDTTFAEGGSWVNPGGQVHAVQDVSDVASRAFTTFLVPRSATQVTVPVTAASNDAGGPNASAANGLERGNAAAVARWVAAGDYYAANSGVNPAQSGAAWTNISAANDAGASAPWLKPSSAAWAGASVAPASAAQNVAAASSAPKTLPAPAAMPSIQSYIWPASLGLIAIAAITALLILRQRRSAA